MSKIIYYDIAFYDGEKISSKKFEEALDELSDMGFDRDGEYDVQLVSIGTNSTGVNTVAFRISQDSEIIINNLRKRDNIVDLRSEQEG